MLSYVWALQYVLYLILCYIGRYVLSRLSPTRGGDPQWGELPFGLLTYWPVLCGSVRRHNRHELGLLLVGPNIWMCF